MLPSPLRLEKHSTLRCVACASVETFSKPSFLYILPPTPPHMLAQRSVASLHVELAFQNEERTNRPLATQQKSLQLKAMVTTIALPLRTQAQPCPVGGQQVHRVYH